MATIVIELPANWRGGKRRPRKPVRLKGFDWTTNGDSLSIYTKNGDPVMSFAAGEWVRVRRES
jgi:hypothetical protein